MKRKGRAVNRSPIRATMFVENPILSWFPLKQLLGASELHLPFGTQKIAPIAVYDVAEVCTNVLIDPSAHISMSYELTGPELKDVLPRTSAGPSNEIRAFAKHWKPHDDAAVHRRQSQFCTFQLERSACGENDVTPERRA